MLRLRVTALAALLGVAMMCALGALAEEHPGSAADSQLQARRFLELAQELYLQERWVDSGEAFLAAHVAAPVPALLYNAGQAFRRGRACERSLECFQRYAADDDAMRRDPAVQSALAEGAGSRGGADPCATVERLHRAFFEARQPTSQDRRRTAQALSEEAQERYLQERFLEAAELFEQAYEVCPHPAFLWNLGLSYLRAEQWLESLLAFEHYLAEGPVEVRRHSAVLAAIAALESEPYAEDERARALSNDLRSAILRAESEQTTAESEP